MKAKSKKFRLAGAAALSVLLVACLGTSTVFAMADDEVETDTSSSYAHYYSDYNSLEEAAAAQEQINKSVAEEGIVLLKNKTESNGSEALPLAKGTRVSVLGIAQDCLCETTGSISQSLKDAGFIVNPTLESLYLNDGLSSSSYGNETILNGTQESSLRAYSDVAVVVLSRGGAGESSDRSLDFEEGGADDYLDGESGWTHEVENETKDKHELQLTDSEQYLIKLAEDNCNKVVVMYSSANQFEMYNLENDDNIDAILAIGRLGNAGIDAVGEILCGDVNPSGKTVDEWTRDFTNDPTYANALASTYGEGAGNSGSSIASSGTVGYDYEEDIYLGYKFYETYRYEAAQGNALKDSSTYTGDNAADNWYADNVVYPFGYGLSYTDFSITLDSVTPNDNSVTLSNISASDLSSNSSEGAAKVTSMTAYVTVTNDGDTAGKEVVQIYVNAPYGEKATTEKSYLTMVGFGKTDTIKPGKSQTISIDFNVQDFASWNSSVSDGAYVLDEGTYNIYAMESSSYKDIDETNASASFTLSDQAVLKLDDYSGNEVSAKFSDSQSEYYSMLLGVETSMEAKVISAEEAEDEVTSLTLTRANFDASMPTAPTTEQMTGLTEDTVDLLTKYEGPSDSGWTVDDEGQPWEKTADDIPSTWDQGTGVINEDTGMYDITLNDMVGVDLYDADGNISSDWVTFINQLTWTEMGDLLNNGSHITGAIASIGKLETEDENGPNYAVSDSYCWAGTPVQAATWNSELLAQFGRVVANMLLWQGRTGFYGPGCNIHRSAFSGRSPEYYSQDGILSGYIGQAIVGAETECGINVYIKHYAVYDSAGIGTGTANVSEQAMRENYLKPFEMIMQGEEGKNNGAHASMTSWNRVGAIWTGQNYMLQQGIARDEWGWTGFFVTDNTWQASGTCIDGLIRTGGNLPDGDISGTATKVLSGEWISSTYKEDGSIDTQGYVTLDGENASPTQWYCARMAVTQILYQEANSAGNFNGVTDTAVTGEIDLTQGVEVTEEQSNIIPEKYTGGDYIILTNVTSGTLPEGLSIVDGILTGAAMTAESSVVTLQVLIDGWIPVELTLTINITPIINMEFDVSSITVGDDVDVYVQFDNDSADIASYNSTSFSISDGALPTGLTMGTDGNILGTATEAGTYTFTIAVDTTDTNSKPLLNMENSYVSQMVSGGMGDDVDVIIAFMNTYMSSMLGGMTLTRALMVAMGWAYYPSNTYSYTYTMTVSGESESTGETSKTVASIATDADGNIVVTYTDNTTQTITISTGSGSSNGTGTDNSGDNAGTVEETSGSSSGNGLAIAGLIVACVAVVAAAVGIVLVLLRKKS